LNQHASNIQDRCATRTRKNEILDRSYYLTRRLKKWLGELVSHCHVGLLEFGAQ